MLRELRVLGIGDLCAARSLDIGAVELLFEGRAHIGQILLAQNVALGGLALGQTDGLGLFCQRVDAVNFGFSMVYVSLLFVFLPLYHTFTAISFYFSEKACIIRKYAILK